MLETSKDLLYIVLAFCVLWLTVFLCWLLYYGIKILRDAARVIDSIQARLKGIEEAVHLVKDKIENASSSMKIIVESVGLMVKYFVNRRADRSENDSYNEGAETSETPLRASPRGRKKPL